MIETIAEAYFHEQGEGSCRDVIAVRSRFRDERRSQHIFEHGTLRQQAVVLKDKPDFFIAKCGEGFLIKLERILAV